MNDPGHQDVIADAQTSGSFSAVDVEPGGASLIAGLVEQASIPAIQRLGVGREARETMLAEARRRAATTVLPIEFRRGDLTISNSTTPARKGCSPGACSNTSRPRA